MKISAIICTSNRPAGLAALLKSLLAQQRLPDQIVIVEDRQGPQPDKPIKAFRDRGVEVVYLRRSPPGLTASRNLALKHADGDLLSFFDDDTIPATDYLSIAEQVFAADTTSQLGGLAAVFDPHGHKPGLGNRLWQFFMHMAGFWSLPHRPRRRIFSSASAFKFGLTPCAYLPGVVTYRRAALTGLSFDRNLSGYALGEDLDLSFSLHPRWQLYRCTSLRIVHNRDPLHRPNHLTWAGMLVRNLLYITTKHSGLRIGTAVVLLWQLTSLCLAHLFFTVLGDRKAHLSYLAGIVLGLPQALKHLHRIHSAGTPRKTSPPPPPQLTASQPRPKNILFVLNTLIVGGAERMTLTLLNNLDPDRFCASLLCLQQPGPLAEKRPPHISFHHNFSRHKLDFSVLFKLIRLITSNRIDLVVSVGNGGDRMFFSSLACLLTGRRLIVWCHSQPSAARKTFERTNRLLTTIPRAFVAVSASQAGALHDVLRIPRSRIHLIKNSLTATPHSVREPSADQLAGFRKKLDLSPNAFLIATVASLRPIKGHDVLIDAAAQVLPQCPDACFLLIGQGPDKQAILDRISRLNLPLDRIQLLGFRPDVPDLLRHCDLFVLPSHSESFGLALLEAMAAGLPVISTDTPGPRSLIDHGRTGLLTPVGQPHQLAQAIIDLHSQPNLQKSLAAQARLFAGQTRFRPAAMVQAFENLFQLLT